jgi:hypothetical protein
MEAAVEEKNCRKSAREEGSVPERTICKEESSDIDAKGRDVVTEIAIYQYARIYAYIDYIDIFC